MDTFYKNDTTTQQTETYHPARYRDVGLPRLKGRKDLLWEGTRLKARLADNKGDVFWNNSPTLGFHNWASRQEDVRRRGGISPRLFNICTRWSWEVSFTASRLLALTRTENSQIYPLRRMLSMLYGHGDADKSVPLPRTEPQAVPTVSM
jgi:hypothetical protein